MKIHSDKRARLEDLKRRYHKCWTLNLKKYISRWFHLYCENTSLHGFRYVAADRSTIFESSVWSMVCISAIVFCVVLMLRLWANYSKHPISTTIDTSNLIWNLPFPAVTVCNYNKIYRPHADIIAKQLQVNGIARNVTEKFFTSLIRLLRPDKILIDDTTARHILEILGMTVGTLMNKLMQPCSALLVRCTWLGQLYDCDKIFKTIMSKEGFCCAFNYHYGNNRYDVKDDPTDFNVTFFPGVERILKTPGSGRDVGLALSLDIEPQNYKASVRPTVGASIIIHDSIDFPDIGAHITSVSPGYNVAISVSGTSIKSTDDMRSLPVKKRLCYFEDEVLGETHYSFQSCISECTVKYLQEVCGCLPFYYPEINVGIRTCYLTDVNCIVNSRVMLSTNNVLIKKTCKKCLPQCNDIDYAIDAEVFKMQDVNYQSELTNGLDLDNISTVYVYFNDISYVEYRKEIMFTWDGLLASFGGIFGLCLGGSVLSAIELFYFMVREFVIFRKTQRRSQKPFPPAAEVFLSVKSQLQKPQNHQEFDDGRVHVTWYHPRSQRRKTINNAHKPVKF